MSNIRNKEYWFVPKRSNIYQMLLIIHGIKIEKMDGKVWSSKHQDDLNFSLKKLGGTRSGNKIAPQGMRTIIASMEYLGFIYLKKPTKTINITKVGKRFYNNYKNLISNTNKKLDKDFLPISNYVKKQMCKLQITNPILLKNCENILVFPLKFILCLLKNLKYLDMEELAMYVFKSKDMSEINYTITQIKIFRNLNKDNRIKSVNAFKQTHLGNISLKQAPSTNYFIKFCTATSLVKKEKYMPKNYDKKLNIISIVPNKINDVQKLINQNNNIYNFHDNSNLWIKYFGDPDIVTPPFSQTIMNKTNKILLVNIENYFGDIINIKILDNNEYITTPFFNNKIYYIKLYNLNQNDHVPFNKIKKIKASKNNNILKIKNINKSFISNELNSFNDIKDEIINHSKAKHFSNRMKKILYLLKKVSGENKFYNKNLRGAYYESLFYKLLKQLEKNNIIENLQWNGQMHSKQYGLPSQAPGGKEGTPDIIFTLNNIDYVLEVTTIKSKSAQYSAEAASVPDHIKQYNRNNSRKVRGIFCSPKVHERISDILQGTLNMETKINIINISDKSFINIFNSSNSKELQKKLDKNFNKNN